MVKSARLNVTKAATFFMLVLGVLLVVISAFYVSSFLEILGVAIVIWGLILLFITPSKHVPLTLLNAVAASANSNVERVLAQTNFAGKGRYLPPTYLRDFESSIIFIPENSKQCLPRPEEVVEEKMFAESENLMFLTPPGLALSKLFEKEVGTSFVKTDLAFVERKLPKVLVEDMELAEGAEVQVQGDKVSVELSNSVLSQICEETRSLPSTHSQVGCLLSSAVACVLAKASGKVVTIQSEELTDDGVTRIEYLLESVDRYSRVTTVADPPQASQAPTEKITATPAAATEVIAKPKVMAEARVLTEPVHVNKKFRESEARAKTVKLSGLPVLEEEVDSRALDFLKRNGEVFILTDVENPQFTYSGIKSYDGELSVQFIEFAEICRAPNGSEDEVGALEFLTETFNVSSPASPEGSNLELYVSKSGFSTVNEWLKIFKIPEYSSGNKKTLYLYHVQTIV